MLGVALTNKEIKTSVDFGEHGMRISGYSVNEKRYGGYGIERFSDRKGTDLFIAFNLSAEEPFALSKAASDAASGIMKGGKQKVKRSGDEEPKRTDREK